MPDVSIVVLFHFHYSDYFFCLVLFWWPEFGESHLCSFRQPQFGHFSGYHSQNVWIEILEPLSHPDISKKQESHPVLATSICLSLIFAVAFSFIICCLLLLYHEDIFEKRNVHECLQCPPHWNTWGKVSSLTLWSIPAPQLEPQLLVPPLMRTFFSWWWAIFLASSRPVSSSNWN